MRNEFNVSLGFRASKDIDPGAWLPLVTDYRVGIVGHQRVIQADLRPDLGPDSPEVVQVVETFSGRAMAGPGPDGGSQLSLVQDVTDPPATRWWLHGLLFVLTLISTLGAGALMAGVDPFLTRILWLGDRGVPYPTGLHWPALLVGAPFSLTFLFILTAHEMGHYVAARIHGIAATLPFFLPFPPYFSVVGTLGAFIRLRGVMIRRSTLLDVGASGPWLSFGLAALALAWGLPRSHLVPGFVDGWTPFAISFMGETVWLGGGILSWWMADLLLPVTPGGELILLHPVAFAGWLGLFITSLNLLPLGQLDGGHVTYALLGEGQRLFGGITLLAMMPLGLLWGGWWVWGVLAVLLSRGRLAHPKVLQPRVPLDPFRAWLARGAIFVFFVTLPPLPIRI